MLKLMQRMFLADLVGVSAARLYAMAEQAERGVQVSLLFESI